MSTPLEEAGPSTAHRPDLDWSQVRETVRMLELAAAQILTAMKDGDDSVGTLTDSFASLAGTVNSIAEAAITWHDASDTMAMRSEVLSHSAQAQASIQSAIVAFQFYDKLAQRLDHVTQVLSDLSELVRDQRRLYDPSEWLEMQMSIRSRYSMHEEQEMFDALLAGQSVEEALERVKEKLSHGDIDDITLF